MRVLAIVILVHLSNSLFSQYEPSREFITDSLTESIFLLRNSYGSNIGVYMGEDGMLLIDSHLREDIDSILVHLNDISSLPVKYLINTHWHFDHVENNEVFANQGAIIIAHENCRDRLSEDQVVPIFMPVQAATPKKGLPSIIFKDSMNIYINDEIVSVFHLPNAHTNSDAVIYFRNSNVLHTGDIFVRYGMPFLDLTNGGLIDGMIAACEYISALSNERTRIIPGHGPISNKQDLINYTDMLKTIRKRIVEAINDGQNLEQVIESKPAKEYNTFIDKEKLLELYYKSLQQRSN